MRGSGSALEHDPLGDLVGRERPRAVGAQLLRRGRRAGARDDDRRHGLAPLRVAASEHSRLEHLRVRLEHRLDLDRRDVLAAADDRVGLAPRHVQAPALVELAEVAGVQPAIGGERRGCDGRPRQQDLSVAGDLHAGAEQRRAGVGLFVCVFTERPGVRELADFSDGRRRRLRAALGEAVGEADRHAGRPGAPQQRRRHRAAAGERARSAGGRSRPASSSRASVVATRLTSVTRCSWSACSTRSSSKRSCTTALVA